MSFHDDRECKMVSDFHVRFAQIVSYAPSHLTRRKLRERFVSMLEEVLEFGEACGLRVVDTVGDDIRPKDCGNYVVHAGSDYDYPTMVDSLVDLVYFAKGTAVMMGVPWAPLFDDVQRANMAKVPGITHRGFLMDVKKPEGWVGPQTQTILERYGYNPSLWVDASGYHDDAKAIDDPIHKPETAMEKTQ